MTSCQCGPLPGFKAVETSCLSLGTGGQAHRRPGSGCESFLYVFQAAGVRVFSTFSRRANRRRAARAAVERLTRKAQYHNESSAHLLPSGDALRCGYRKRAHYGWVACLVRRGVLAVSAS
jgi:hypothetical protein